MPRITISEPGKTPQPYRLKTDRELTKIGRGSDNDIVLKTGSASTYHCKMKRVEGGFILEDNNSTNGILLDDTRFEIIDLEDDMTAFIGDDIELHFSLSEEEIETLEEEDFEPHQRAAFPKPKEPKETKKKKPVAIEEEDDDDEEEYEEVVVRRKKKKKKPVAVEEDEDDYEDDEDEVVAPPKKRKKKPVALDLEDDEDDAVTHRKKKKRKPVGLDLDDEDEDEDDRPRSKKPKSKLATGGGSASPSPRPAAAAPVVSTKAGGGAGVTVLFAVLAVVCLLAGMCLRHALDNDGAFLFSKQEQGK